jgi:hypothetical protein
VFTETPANKASLSQRKLAYGVGINDAPYNTSVTVKGKVYYCSYYRRWRCMLDRCYSLAIHSLEPTYKGCVVCSEWLLFSNFKAWMKTQDWKGKELDKDLLVQGNKVYSPDYCIFVSAKINKLFSTGTNCNSKTKKGTSYDKKNKKYRAACNSGYKHSKNLGLFDTEIEAHDAYKEFKYNAIKEVAMKQSEPLKSALLNYKIT